MRTLSDAARERIRENLRKMAEEREAKAKRSSLQIKTYYSEEIGRRVTVPEKED